MRIALCLVLLTCVCLTSRTFADRGGSGSRGADHARSAARRALENRSRLGQTDRARSGPVDRLDAAGTARRSRLAPSDGTGRLARERGLDRARQVADGNATQGLEQASTRHLRRRLDGKSAPHDTQPASDTRIAGENTHLQIGGRNETNRPRRDNDRLLAKRLATIDKLRDQALENGNERLLEQADRLEELARRQHARGTSDEPFNASDIFKRERTATEPTADDNVVE